MGSKKEEGTLIKEDNLQERTNYLALSAIL
jgi:hypothetical protein